MLKKNLKELNNNVFNEIGNVWPILVAGDRNIGYNGMTVSWGGLGVLWGKNVAFVFVRKSRHTYKFIDNSDSVTLSFLSDEYKSAKSLFGSKSGRDINKFEEAHLHATLDLDFNGYYVAEADYVLKMKKIYSVDIPYETLPQGMKDTFYPTGDMHTMYVCEIKQYLVNEE
ncbi:MAG: flavin reductase [Acholeplasmatales bacterium]|nr:flavin reductase [Acholeplasmatales bacterium]